MDVSALVLLTYSEVKINEGDENVPLDGILKQMPTP